MKKACHVLYTDLVTPCPRHGLHSCEHSVSCGILHSAHTKLSCADSPRSGCYLWSVSRVLCFPSVPSVLEGLTEGWELLSCEAWRLGKRRKDFIFFLCCFNCKRWTGKFETTLLFFSVKPTHKHRARKDLKRMTSPLQLWDRTECTKHVHHGCSSKLFIVNFTEADPGGCWDCLFSS